MTTKRAMPLRSAEAGGYGARAFLPEREKAMTLLECIQQELGGAQWFTRDDLLSVSAFAHVSTITRYQYVSESVTYLLRKRLLTQRSRTELALPGRGRPYETPLDLANRHMQALNRKAMDCAKKFGGTVTVADVLQSWDPTSEALAPNVRRAAIRTALRRMAIGGVLLPTETPGAYKPARK